MSKFFLGIVDETISGADENGERFFDNISRIIPDRQYDYYYNVKTMDGKVHKKAKGKRTNYTVVFYNDLNAYDDLKSYFERTHETTAYFPAGNLGITDPCRYYVSIIGEKLIGRTVDNRVYYSGLEVLFEKVDYDE